MGYNSALHEQLKGDFKQRKKSTLSKPVTNHRAKGVTKELGEIQCGWEINTTVYSAIVQSGKV